VDSIPSSTRINFEGLKCVKKKIRKQKRYSDPFHVKHGMRRDKQGVVSIP
jgi:hypothetical protein